MSTILERAVEHTKSRTVMTDEEFAALMHRDADLPIAGNDLARLLACGAMKAVGTSAIKREIVSGNAGAPRVHNVILEENYATEDHV